MKHINIVVCTIILDNLEVLLIKMINSTWKAVKTCNKAPVSYRLHGYPTLEFAKNNRILSH